ncbi:S9 family peptidase [Asticcacaulis sp. AND118]|uniref:alpha/beta hydrolase family protein n=1 Tax=Asticcacaulis sp. AND118 TaxID=2840468 RepID=UPI001D0012F9|nr:prolyl oligopeptidase family serine peptidase [Asticcacaulis sp. AND118]UDF05179.1 prolyl oligopeptidase family serine peptidase [Asticcacaulis sp. AND118]
MLKSPASKTVPSLRKALLCLSAAAVAGLALPLMSTRALAEPVSIEALAQYEQTSGVTISPDGKHIAALVAAKGQKWPVISIWQADDLSKPPVWIPSATNRITGVGFFGNDKIIFRAEQEITRSDGRLSFTVKTYTADIDGKNITEPFKTGGRSEANTVGDAAAVWHNGLYDEDKVIIRKPNAAGASEYYELSRKTGATRLVAKDSEKWSFLPAGVNLTTGEPLIRQSVDVRDGGKFYLITQVKDIATGQWIDHPELGFVLEQRVDLEILGYDSDPNKLFVRTNRGRDHSAIYSYDIRAKKFTEEPLYANEKYDIVNIGFKHDFTNKKLEYVSALYVGGPSQIQVLLDEKWAGLQRQVKASFPGKNVNFRMNRAYDKAVITVDAVDFPTEYYIFQDGKLAKIGSERPWIDPKTLGKGEFVTYKARDGLEIPAIVTYPPQWTPEKGPVPLIVLPHGGPWARDYMDWDGSGWPQFLATRGIAVIQPQYRGSEGWGDKLWKAGDKEWGQKMSDDNDDAAAFMVSKGVADPKRLAIFGYSYGGFAAIAASVRPDSPYRCAIAGAGVSSLERLGNFWGSNHIQRDIQGHTVKGMDPMKNIDKANIPILLYHGDRDRQADTDHSRMFYRAMKAAGKDVQYVEIKDMWHTLPWRPAWHTETLTLIENYLKSDKCGLM